jgi:uncharacterized small protein (DUF1192 family)
MLEEPPPPKRGRGDALIEAEIRRARAQMERKQSGRAAADALFKR